VDQTYLGTLFLLDRSLYKRMRFVPGAERTIDSQSHARPSVRTSFRYTELHELLSSLEMIDTKSL